MKLVLNRPITRKATAILANVASGPTCIRRNCTNPASEGTNAHGQPFSLCDTHRSIVNANLSDAREARSAEPVAAAVAEIVKGEESFADTISSLVRQVNELTRRVKELEGHPVYVPDSGERAELRSATRPAANRVLSAEGEPASARKPETAKGVKTTHEVAVALTEWAAKLTDAKRAYVMRVAVAIESGTLEGIPTPAEALAGMSEKYIAGTVEGLKRHGVEFAK